MSVDFGYEASTNGAGHSAAGPEGRRLVAPTAELLKARPEVVVGVAFAGGVLAALLLRRLGR
jgi:ABC-type uncharacterized transport system permease subunit